MSIIAVGFVTWMIFWMRRTARFLKTELQGKLDAALPMGTFALDADRVPRGRPRGPRDLAVPLGRRPGRPAAARPRSSAPASASPPPSCSATCSTGGRSRINLAKFFTWTGAGLIIVAGGVLAYGVHDLQEAGDLPGLNNLAFDVSDAVPPDSWYGTLLKGIFNFSPADDVARGGRLAALRRARHGTCSSARPGSRPTPHRRHTGIRTEPSTVAEPRTRPPTRTPRPDHHSELPHALVRPATPPPARCAAAAPAGLTACGGCSARPAPAPRSRSRAGDDACKVSETELQAGGTTFAVTNDGDKVTEVYVYGEQGGAFTKVVSEVENIGPGTSRDMDVDLAAGTYEIACKPGQKGDGIRQKITVTGERRR